VETYEALASERGESGKIWASVLKSAIKRRKPGFSEAQYGFRAFGNLLDEAQSRGLLEVGRDEKNGSFVFRTASVTAVASVTTTTATEQRPAEAATAQEFAAKPNRRKERRPRKSEPQTDIDTAIALPVPTVPEETVIPVEQPVHEAVIEPVIASEEPPRRKRKGAAKKTVAEVEQAPPVSQASAEVTNAPADEPKEPAVKKPSRKSSLRAARSRKSVEKESSQ
jgi:hypothetical protein